jgi:hypothetical protein
MDFNLFGLNFAESGLVLETVQRSLGIGFEGVKNTWTGRFKGWK